MALIIALIATFLTAVTASAASQMTGDMLLLAYSWQPEFCYNQKSYASCSPPQEFWKTHFTIHGLWPEYSSGGYPQSCTKEPFDKSVATKIGWDTMTKYWPNVKSAESSADYYSFWEHEWSKHGTCTGLTQENYFRETIDLTQKFGTPQVLSDAVGSTISAETLRNSMGGKTKVSLQCNSGKYLSGVYTCWSQNNGVPKTQIECPKDVQKGDTCSASSIIVTAF